MHQGNRMKITRALRKAEHTGVSLGMNRGAAAGQCSIGFQPVQGAAWLETFERRLVRTQH